MLLYTSTWRLNVNALARNTDGSAMPNTPKPHELAEALRQDQRISPDIYEMFRGHIGKLPEVVGELWMSRPLDSHILTVLRIRYMRRAIKDGVLNEYDADLQAGHLDMIEAALPNQLQPTDSEFEAALITPPSVTFDREEQERMLHSPNIGLSDDLKERYRSGTLTVGDAVRLQPGIFILRY